MSALDIFILLPLAWFAFKGYRNGLIKEVISLAALLVGAWLTLKYYDDIAARFGESATTKTITFVVIFLAVIIIAYFVANLLERIITWSIGDFLNKLLGLLFGVLKVLFVFSVIFYFINTIDTKEQLFTQKIKNESLLYKYTAPIAPKIYNWSQTVDYQ